jgi:DivIVA domain-containing protein
MAIEEQEVAALRPEDIEGHRFTIEERGYDPGEVRPFLRAVAEHVGRLEGEIDWQRARVEHLEQRGVSAQESAYDRISNDLMEVLRRTDEAAMDVRVRAEEEARAALGRAREDANRMVALAAGEAERILLTARAQAERMVADATGQIERLVREEAMRGEPSLEAPVARHASNGHSISEPAFSAFEDLDLHFDGSLFDLFGEAGS